MLGWSTVRAEAGRGPPFRACVSLRNATTLVLRNTGRTVSYCRYRNALRRMAYGVVGMCPGVDCRRSKVWSSETRQFIQMETGEAVVRCRIEFEPFGHWQPRAELK